MGQSSSLNIVSTKYINVCLRMRLVLPNWYPCIFSWQLLPPLDNFMTEALPMTGPLTEHTLRIISNLLV